jgi:adenosine deaminase
MRSFIKNIPKAELHIHIEGSLEPELMFTIAERNGLALPFDSVEDVYQAYEFEDLQSFLDIYYQGTNVLIHEQDFYDMTWAYLKKAGEHNVRHAEISFDPQTHTKRGVRFETVINGIKAALQNGQQQLGISSKLIMCFLRHLGLEEALDTLMQGLPHKEWIIAVGLDSSELGYPPEKFSPVFDRARDEGLLTVAHAGEEGPPEYILHAIDNLKVSRIDHGVRCLENPSLVERLIKEQIPLTVCPLSNVRLRVFDSLAKHNLKQMLDLGICVTINSDDPAYFGGYIGDNFQAVQEALGLNDSDIFKIVRNGFQASFIHQDKRERLMEELDNFVREEGRCRGVISTALP